MFDSKGACLSALFVGILSNKVLLVAFGCCCSCITSKFVNEDLLASKPLPK